MVIMNNGWQWPDDEKVWVNPEPSSVHLAPGSTNHFIFTSAEELTVTAETPMAVRREAMALYGRAVANYHDVFGEAHEAAFHVDFSGENCWRTNKAKVSSKGNRVTWPRHQPPTHARTHGAFDT